MFVPSWPASAFVLIVSGLGTDIGGVDAGAGSDDYNDDGDGTDGRGGVGGLIVSSECLVYG